MIIINILICSIIEIEEPPKKTVSDYFIISPRNCIKLEPHKKFCFVIEFTPTERIENFSEQVHSKFH